MVEELNDLKKGEVIVRFGVLHKISKVEQVTLPSGEKDQLIHFAPLFKTRRNETLKLSIPVSNLDKTTIRLPVTKTQLNEELKFLRQAEYQKAPFNQLKVKKIISENQLHDLSEVLKAMWEEKRDERKNFTISKRNTYYMALNRFKQETAHVLGVDLEAAEKKIEAALDTGWSRHLKVKKSP